MSHRITARELEIDLPADEDSDMSEIPTPMPGSIEAKDTSPVYGKLQVESMTDLQKPRRVVIRQPRSTYQKDRGIKKISLRTILNEKKFVVVNIPECSTRLREAYPLQFATISLAQHYSFGKRICLQFQKADSFIAAVFHF